MQSLKLALFCVIILVMTQPATSQSRFYGRVVQVIDGRTLVLELPTGKITAVLQYIEIPEAEQALHQTVRDHIDKMITGKNAEFLVVGIAQDKMSGQLFVDGVDIGQQMLRDGAAWLVPIDKSGQLAAEYTNYKSNESQAKAERRGVWGIDRLKPAWEFRAEKQEMQHREEDSRRLAAARRYSASGDPAPGRPGRNSVPQTGGSNLEAWADVYAGVGKEGAGLVTGYDSNQKIGWIATSGAFVYLKEGSERQKLECRTIYAYKDFGSGYRETIYMIGFQSISADFKFSKLKSRLTVTADKQAISLGWPRGFRGQTYFGAREIFYYKVSRQSLIKIANAKTLGIKIDRFAGNVSAESQALIKQLADSTK